MSGWIRLSMSISAFWIASPPWKCCGKGRWSIAHKGCTADRQILTIPRPSEPHKL